jgi:hypothetical protein
MRFPSSALRIAGRFTAAGAIAFVLGCSDARSTSGDADVDDASVNDGGIVNDGGSRDSGLPTATLLFASGFGPGISLGEPYGFAGRGAWQDLLGTDLDTGFTFPGPNAPDALLGAHFFGVQLIAPEPIDASTVGDNVVNEIQEVVGPDGNVGHALFQNVITGSGWNAQAPLLINRHWARGEVPDLYISYWFRYPEGADDQLYLPGGGSRVQFEFKTGGYMNDWPGDYRISTVVMKGEDGRLYWMAKGDNVANGPWPRVDYWREDNHDVPVPIGEWFFYEVYWHRSGGSDGRFWSAVNGEVIVDHVGPNMGDYGLPIARIMIVNPYSGGNAPVQHHVTDFEIWDGFPCGIGASCYSR